MSNGTVIVCGGNGAIADPPTLTITIKNHTRANIAVAADTHGLDHLKAAMLTAWVKHATYLLAEGIEKITGDKYEQHVGDPPPNPSA